LKRRGTKGGTKGEKSEGHHPVNWDEREQAFETSLLRKILSNWRALRSKTKKNQGSKHLSEALMSWKKADTDHSGARHGQIGGVRKISGGEGGGVVGKKSDSYGNKGQQRDGSPYYQSSMIP